MDRMSFVMTLPRLAKGKTYGQFSVVANSVTFTEVQGYIELDYLHEMIDQIETATRVLPKAMTGKWALSLDLDKLAEARKLARQLDRRLAKLEKVYLEVLPV